MEARQVVATPEAYNLLHQGAITLAKIESAGIKIDTEYLDNAIKETNEKIKELGSRLREDEVWAQWRKRYGQEANLDSLPQLTEVLFGCMGVPYPSEEKTETGRWKADEETLSKVAHPFVKDYILLGRLQDDRGKYLGGLRRETVNGYFHPNFNLHTASTYRSSSGSDKGDEGRMGKDYNFQNIPTRDPIRAKLIRSAFIPRDKNHCLVEVDFKGIEVCVAACYNHDPVLIKYIKDPTTDMHRDTAADLFFLGQKWLIKHKDWAKKTVRDWAKNRFVFPSFYGSVFFQCAPNLWEGVMSGIKMPDSDLTLLQHLENHGITKGLGAKVSDYESGRIRTEKGTFMEQVRLVEESFWKERFKVYTEWKIKFWSEYLKTGEFLTHTGFRIGPIGKKGMLVRNDVLNYPIQGSAFHCLLWVLIRLQRCIDKYKMKSRLIGQIHDSVLGDVPDDELQDYLDIATDLISNRLPKAWKWIIVPMNAEAEVCPPGESWFTKKGWVLNGQWGPDK